MGEVTEREPGKARKRRAVKGASQVESPAASKVKTTIHLSVEASQRLAIHATMMGLDRSALAEQLIHDHLRRWVVSDRARPGEEKETEKRTLRMPGPAAEAS